MKNKNAPRKLQTLISRPLRSKLRALIPATIALLLISQIATAQTSLGSAFTYQGHLQRNGQPADGAFDLHFRLYDGPDPASDTPVEVLLKNGVVITDGLFTVDLDFGADEFDGSPRWLEIGAREAGESIFEYVTPLQELTAVPYSQYAQRAGNAQNLDGRDSSEFVTDEADPTVREDVKDGVEWSEISNIPDGIGQPEADPTVVEHVKDGVEWLEISNIPVGIGEPETDPTVQNNVKDGVDWTELTGIPDGFADGVDHGITGETDPTVNEDVKDGVDWSEVSNIPQGFLDGVDDTSGLPAGIITMWSGRLVDIPAGWILCDGSNGTPDLRNRFVAGVSIGEDPGATGGSDSHGHSTSSAGSHAHSGSTSVSGNVSAAGNPPDKEVTQGNHSHSIVTNAAGNHAHSTNAANHLPPYYHIAFIMKLP